MMINGVIKCHIVVVFLINYHLLIYSKAKLTTRSGEKGQPRELPRHSLRPESTCPHASCLPPQVNSISPLFPSAFSYPFPTDDID